MTSFWWSILVFFDEVFIFTTSVICKKYTNTNGKDSKYIPTPQTKLPFDLVVWEWVEGVRSPVEEEL